MPRKPRVEYPGAVCHVMSRGDRSEDIFLDDVDRQSRRCGTGGSLSTDGHEGTRTNTDLSVICVYPCPSVVGAPAVTDRLPFFCFHPRWMLVVSLMRWTSKFRCRIGRR
jgi:hypothetical protein